MYDIKKLFLYVSGNQNSLQVFTGPDVYCNHTDIFQLEYQWTSILMDQLTSTCFALSPGNSTEDKHVWLKLPYPWNTSNQHNHRFSIHIQGHGISCSPVHGLQVSLHHICDDNAATCKPSTMCVSIREVHHNNLTTCQSRCQPDGPWEVLIVRVVAPAFNVAPSLCEVWFRL